MDPCLATRRSILDTPEPVQRVAKSWDHRSGSFTFIIMGGDLMILFIYLILRTSHGRETPARHSQAREERKGGVHPDIKVEEKTGPRVEESEWVEPGVCVRVDARTDGRGDPVRVGPGSEGRGSGRTQVRRTVRLVSSQ